MKRLRARYQSPDRQGGDMSYTVRLLTRAAPKGMCDASR
jgi:hypothetical protein